MLGGRSLAGVVTAAAVLLAPASAPALGSARAVPFQRAVTVAEWGPTAYAPAPTAELMRALRARHVDTVTLVVVWAQANRAATSIRPGPATVPEGRLKAAIRSARRAGLRVVLRPYVDVPDRPADRLALEPSSRVRWWASYDAFVLRFAALAQAERVAGFVVGSELTSMAGDGRRWRGLVGKVRRRFGGFVTYQANWYREPWAITWWDAVDAISVSAYFPLATKAGATRDALVRGWTKHVDQYGQTFRWRRDLQALSSRFRRPVVFGEIGYRTVADTAVHPWSLARGRYDEAAQAVAYEAAFAAWYRTGWFRGFHWWYVNPQPELLEGKAGADHRPTPRALAVLGSWYRRQR